MLFSKIALDMPQLAYVALPWRPSICIMLGALATNAILIITFPLTSCDSGSWLAHNTGCTSYRGSVIGVTQWQSLRCGVMRTTPTRCRVLCCSVLYGCMLYWSRVAEYHGIRVVTCTVTVTYCHSSCSCGCSCNGVWCRVVSLRLLSCGVVNVVSVRILAQFHFSTIIVNTQCFATFLPYRAPASSFL